MHGKNAKGYVWQYYVRTFTYSGLCNRFMYVMPIYLYFIYIVHCTMSSLNKNLQCDILKWYDFCLYTY